jgi:hypothetical protein
MTIVHVCRAINEYIFHWQKQAAIELLGWKQAAVD